jgi:hypothetical protein
MSPVLDDEKDDFVESIGFVPENFGETQDSLPAEAKPEIPDEDPEKNTPAAESAQGEVETTAVEPGAKKEGEEGTDEQPKIDPAEIAAELAEVKKRLDKAEARAGFWQRKAEKKPDAIAPAVEELKAIDKPKFEDFADEAAYFDALTDYKVEIKLREQEVKKRAEAELVESQGLSQWLNETGADGVSRFSDFEEIVTDPVVPITKQIVSAIRSVGSKEASHAEILYYLGKNIRETAKISRLTPEAISREIGAIATKIAAENAKPATEAEPKHKPKETTKAPPPITPIRAASLTVSKDPEKMTNEEYRKWRMGSK